MKPRPQEPPFPSPPPLRILGAVLIVAVFGAYANTLNAPFFFDDNPGILLNPSIRDLGDLGSVLLPPPLGGAGTAGRPIVNLSLAFNYAIGGEDVFGYHLFNIVVHALAVLTLLGLVRRTLELPSLRDSRPGWAAVDPRARFWIAAGTASIWGLHPLLTETVSCVIQRTEGLAGLFFLLCFYCFVRLLAEPGRWRWAAFALAACAIGVATKEVLVAAPVLLLLFDRTFGAGSFAEAWKRRRLLHLGFMLTWVLLAAVMWLSASRGGTVGFGRGVVWWEYLLTQCRAIVLYLRLAVWPHPLVVDYGEVVVRDPLAVWPQAVLLVGLAVATLWALWRRPVVGFLGAWFFCILAPSSSVVPLVTQTIAEHRMYLPLIPLVAAAVWALVRWLPRSAPALLVGLGLALAVTTFARNRAYRSVEAIWADAAIHCPDNYRIHYSLGQNCDSENRLEDSIAHYEAALRLKPDHTRSHYNLAAVLAALGRLEPAREHYSAVLEQEPRSVDAVVGLGTTLMRLGRVQEARDCFARAQELAPGSAKNAFNLGQACFQLGEIDESIRWYRVATTLEEGFVEAYERLGGALAAAGKLPAAAEAYRSAVQLDGQRTRSWSNLGIVLYQLGRMADAVSAFESALRTKPGDAAIERNLALARAALER